MFTTIVITMPAFIDAEAERIVRLLCSGVTLVHIRKPVAEYDEVERLVCSVPAEWRGRLVLHDHFSLAQRYSLYGVHLNRRNPQPPAGWKGCVSRSCHSLDEVVRYKDACDYLSLSPIFDSISKQGYRSAFTQDDICSAVSDGIIDSKVYALGGVTFAALPALKALGFGGAMMLGDAWR